jgi:glycosyltransferase involved in cell wall biosynthesis
MKVAFVTPRYATDGGAETATRLLAEALVARRGIEVEVLTTTAIDMNWTDGFSAGSSVAEGVRIERFAVDRARADDFALRSDRLLRAPRRATDAIEQGWLESQGPVSRDLITAIAACDADVISMGPYLYHPIVEGARRSRRPVILHGAAHDEPPLSLAVYRDLYERVDGLAFWSNAERALVLDRFAVASTPQAVIGLGVDGRPGDEAAARLAVGLDPGQPYLLCLGRVDDLKGTRLAARLFTSYAGRHPGDLVMVFAGAVVDAPDAHPSLRLVGKVDEATKWGLIQGASALVSPSAFESFGIVLFEAWSLARPVLVNARCAVTLEHVRSSGGGVVFADQADFDSAVQRLVNEPGTTARFGHAGLEYSRRMFSWDAVLDRYLRLVEQVLRHCSG